MVSSKSANTLPADGRDSLIARLDCLREISHAFGYGVGDAMDYLLSKYPSIPIEGCESSLRRGGKYSPSCAHLLKTHAPSSVACL